MSTRILYTTNNVPLGQLLSSVISRLVDDKQRLGILYSVMDCMAQGGTYNAIEQEVGVVEGSGQAVYNVIAGLKAAMDNSAFDDLSKLYKG
jgi:hypothetical protein